MDKGFITAEILQELTQIVGKKFIFTDDETLKKYDAIDVNVYQANIFHTKMLIKDIELQNYLFNKDVYEINPKTRLEITNNLRREMIEIFSGYNVYGGGSEIE